MAQLKTPFRATNDLLCADAESGSVRMCADAIPRVNLSKSQEEIVLALRAASSGPGIFYLVGHAIAQPVLDDVLAAIDDKSRGRRR